MSGNERYTVKLMYLHHTPGAVLVLSPGPEDAWFPLDCVEITENLDIQQRGNIIEVETPAWLLEKYGLDFLA